MRSVPRATPILLTDAERAELEGLARSTKSEHRMRQRARIVLLAADGLATRAIGHAVGCTTGTASKWRVRYAAHRLAGLDETGDRGAEAKYTAESGRRILAVLDGPPPPGHGRWTAPLISAALGDVHEQYVWRFLRAQKIDLAGRKSWCVSNDPEFAAKAAEIVGLYLAPPDGALVLAVDEKPHIQALERAQGYLKLPNGRALGGQAHQYTRHGTSTLFAAFDVACGTVVARHYQRRRRIEFLDFRRRPRRARNPRHPRQSQHPQAQARRLAGASQERAFPLHADPCLLAQPGRMLVLDPRRPIAAQRQLHRRRPTQKTHRCLYRALQPKRPSLCLAQIRSPSEAPQTALHGPLIPGTSWTWSSAPMLCVAGATL